jgi:hypothetical protein
MSLARLEILSAEIGAGQNQYQWLMALLIALIVSMPLMAITTVVSQPKPTLLELRDASYR